MSSRCPAPIISVAAAAGGASDLSQVSKIMRFALQVMSPYTVTEPSYGRRHRMHGSVPSSFITVIPCLHFSRAGQSSGPARDLGPSGSRCVRSPHRAAVHRAALDRGNAPQARGRGRGVEARGDPPTPCTGALGQPSHGGKLYGGS